MLLHGHRPVRPGVAGPGQAASQDGIGRVQHRVGGDDAMDEAGSGREQTQADRTAPVLDDEGQAAQVEGRHEPESQSMWACTEYAVRSSGLSERPKPIRSGATARSPRWARPATTVR